MNDKLTNDPDAENEKIAQRLAHTAETVHANAHFLDELEQTLRARHQPRRNWLIGSLKQLTPALGWVLVPLVVGLVLVSSIRSLATLPGDSQTPTTFPTLEPEPTATSVGDNSPTPDPIGAGDTWAWRGTTLSIGVSLPDGPGEADVYLWKHSQPITAEEARALAERFGISAEPQAVPGELPGFSDYTVTDGVQSLRLRADHYFTYHSNAGELSLETLTEEQAQSIADTFLKRNGFDFDYKFERAPDMQGQNFTITPLLPGGHEMRFDYLIPTSYEITLDNTGENIVFSGYWLDYESQGTFGIISAEEAFFELMNPRPQAGIIETVRGQGGGGGGSSFLKINLSGTPVPFPSEIPSANSNEKILGSAGSSLSMTLPEDDLIQLKIGDRFEGARGIFQVNIYETSRRIWYGFFETGADKGNMPYLILEGDNLSDLHKHNNLPLNIWGTVDRFDSIGRPIVKVERYEIPFPGLKYQIIEGSEKLIEIQGQRVLTFITSDGTQYVQIIGTVYPRSEQAMFANEGDRLLAEALIVPDESFGGYPTIRIMSTNYAVDPISGRPNKLDITATEFGTYEEPSLLTYTPPTATIEEIDLVFYVRYPPYALLDVRAGTQYLQPAWRFYGHYSNGDEFEILVQALKQEFLLPELAPYTPPG